MSFPRCGHTLTAALLISYYAAVETDARNTGIYVQAKPAYTFGYCDFYTHCKSTPCPDSRTTFQKQHDTGVRDGGTGITYSADAKYVVLCRNPIDSIASTHRGTQDGVHFDEKIWPARVTHSLVYWRNLFNKWVRPMHPNALYIDYEDLVASPLPVLQSVIELLTPGTFNAQLAAAAIKMHDVRIRHRYHFEGNVKTITDNLLASVSDELALMKTACSRERQCLST